MNSTEIQNNDQNYEHTQNDRTKEPLQLPIELMSKRNIDLKIANRSISHEDKMLQEFQNFTQNEGDSTTRMEEESMESSHKYKMNNRIKSNLKQNLSQIF